VVRLCIREILIKCFMDIKFSSLSKQKQALIISLEYTKNILFLQIPVSQGLVDSLLQTSLFRTGGLTILPQLQGGGRTIEVEEILS